MAIRESAVKARRSRAKHDRG